MYNVKIKPDNRNFTAIYWEGNNKKINHPNIKVYDPYEEFDDICYDCGKEMIEHGLFISNNSNQRNLRVCPDSWVLTNENGSLYNIFTNEEFKENYIIMGMDNNENN